MKGFAGVGKTCLVRRYCFQTYSEIYECTIGLDFQSKIVKLDGGKAIRLQIWDTAGTEIFQTLTASYYRNSAGAIVVFDVTSQESFDTLDLHLNHLYLLYYKLLYLLLIFQDPLYSVFLCK